MDKIRNEHTRGTAQVGRFGEKTHEARLRLCGHVGPTEEMLWVYWQTDADDGVARKEETGMPKRRFKDVVKVDLAEVDVTEEDTEGRNNWRWKIRCGDPCWEKPKEEEEVSGFLPVMRNMSGAYLQ